jgi:formylglycine-generating enzyme required for sulfatase activity/cytochrome oxidase Cu insertion factor (SCO1/SenC/PrrC family)
MKTVLRRSLIALACGLLASPVFASGPAQSIPIRGGKFASVLPPAAGVKEVAVADFSLDRTPVTNAEFARFVQQHREWRREEVAPLFADDRYLAHWRSATDPGNGIRNQPVVNVSWFAAAAYCESRGTRLPTWYEWEYAAAASTKMPDARRDPEWQQVVLSWYSRSASPALAEVGRSQANFYGVQDMHGLVWEWVDDFGGMLVAGDNRQQSDPDSLRFCGPGALTMEQKENYPTLMRIALLSSMKARYTGGAMGFRCAKETGTSLMSAAVRAQPATAPEMRNVPGSSLYRLDAALTNQSGAKHGLDVYAGQPVLVTMFYGSCPAACPLLIDTLRAIERAVPPQQRERVRVLMISIDPGHDSVQSLQELAKTRHIDVSRWTLARTDARTVRRIAAVLDVQYRQLPTGGFNHSSVVTLLSPRGEIVKQSTVLAKADPDLLQALSGIP